MQGMNYVANGNISPCRFVKIDTSVDNRVIQASASTDKVIGISQNWGREPPLPSVSTMYAGEAGDNITVFQDGEQALLELGTGGCAAGDLLVADTNGKGVVVSATGATAAFIGARASTAGLAGDIIRVSVHIQEKYYPALS